MGDRKKAAAVLLQALEGLDDPRQMGRALVDGALEASEKLAVDKREELRKGFV